MEENTTRINCPKSLKSRHKASLYMYPHSLGGMWDCDEGHSGECEHPSTEIETVTYDRMGANGYYQDTEEIYICEDCKEAIEGRSPAQDKADAWAEREIMEACQE